MLLIIHLTAQTFQYEETKSNFTEICPPKVNVGLYPIIFESIFYLFTFFNNKIILTNYLS